MSGPRRVIPGDQAEVAVRVAVPRAAAFRVFTEEIDLWWRRGIAYRAAAAGTSVVRLEAGVGGRVVETFATAAGERIREMGRVTVWDPPARLVLEWRGANFAPSEWTEVEVTFEEGASGTLVTVVHRGWASIRPDHPARHGLEVAPFVRMMGLWWGDLMASLRRHAAGK